MAPALIDSSLHKRRFIKDPLWGNIELLPWEASLLSQFLVNRLHNIIQTSCAYLVYPGMRYSRFLHSIGVMEVATRMFVNVLANSKQEYLEELKHEAQLVKSCFEDEKQADSFAKIITERFKCQSDYALLLGTVRVAALLHDIGHLPYSHIFEFALEGFVKNNIADNLSLLGYRPSNKIQKELTNYHSKLSDIYKDDIALHEKVGQIIIKILCSSDKKSSDTNFVPFTEGALQLWAEQKLPISKSILSFDVDADRIDFVYRDGLFSGLYQSSIDFDRLFAFYELAPYGETDHTTLKARPSLRAASEAEELLLERFHDYKYIMSHHKVHLFDEMLERLLFFCIWDGSLNSILDTIVTLAQQPMSPELLRDRHDRVKAERELLTHFNDSWIDVLLRTAYEKATNDSNALPIALYEGLSEQRNLFKSIFKRDEDYFSKLGTIVETKVYPSIALVVRANKYRWERILSSKLGVHVLVGDFHRKLRIGLSSFAAAEFFGLTYLMEFLKGKQNSSLQLNVWYYSESGVERPDIESEIIEFLKTELAASLP